MGPRIPVTRAHKTDERATQEPMIKVWNSKQLYISPWINAGPLTQKKRGMTLRKRLTDYWLNNWPLRSQLSLGHLWVHPRSCLHCGRFPVAGLRCAVSISLSPAGRWPRRPSGRGRHQLRRLSQPAVIDSLAPSCSPSPGSGRSEQKPGLLRGSLAGRGEHLGEESRAEHPRQRDELSMSMRQKQTHRLRKQTVLGAVISRSVVSDSLQPHGL